MNTKNLNLILLLLTYFATQHDVINAMKRPHIQISNTQQNKQLPPTSKKTKLNNNTAAFLCALCNKSFSRNDNLTVHQKTHTGEKPYTCTFCYKTFSQKSHLTTHQRVHTGEKPYKCDVCDKSFSQSNDLIKHKRIHSKEKPYSCSTCNKSFADKGNLTKHEKSHAKTITSTINLVKNNTKQILIHKIKDISPTSLNTSADSQNILENIKTPNDADFLDWIGK